MIPFLMDGSYKPLIQPSIHQFFATNRIHALCLIQAANNFQLFFFMAQRPLSVTASANFSLNNFSASVHTRASFFFGNSNSEGRRSELNCSEASRGSRVGKMSIETTDKAELPGLPTEIVT